MVHNFFTWNYWNVWLYISRMKKNRTCSFVKPKNVSRLVLKFCFTFQSMDSCVLCKEELRSECVTVAQKGLRTLVTASLQREDELDKLLETIDPLRIHSFCRKKLYS